ncbi:hypothetical protein [Hoylesella timonensis]|nr:hypothetical protein [Hoylesella timonensis]
MKIIENHLLPPKGYKAMNVCGLLFVRKGAVMRDVDYNHEAIHTAQWKELLYVGFLILYVGDFLCKLAKYKKWHKAYRMIVFEREAYDNQWDSNYLLNRKTFSWKEYF